MKEAIYETESGPIHYWISRQAADQGLALVFLPGLTADHRLFDKQIAFFQGRYSVFVCPRAWGLLALSIKLSLIG